MISSRKRIGFKGILFSTFGIFHEWAYGAILLDKPLLNVKVLFGYSLGLFLTQLLIIDLGYQLFKFIKGFKSISGLVTPILLGLW